MPQKIRKLFLFINGLVFAALGAAVFSSADVGMDAFSTLAMGIATQMSISFGTACTVSGLLLLIVLYCLDQRFVKIGGVLYAFGLGIIINLWLTLFATINFSLPTIIEVIGGIIIFSFGIALYISADVGSGAVEAFSLFIADKFKKGMGGIRICMDLCFLLTGIVLHAEIGLGTIFGVILIGPTINFFLKKMQFLDKRIVQENIL